MSVLAAKVAVLMKEAVCSGESPNRKQIRVLRAVGLIRTPLHPLSLVMLEEI